MTCSFPQQDSGDRGCASGHAWQQQQQPPMDQERGSRRDDDDDDDDDDDHDDDYDYDCGDDDKRVRMMTISPR